MAGLLDELDSEIELVLIAEGIFPLSSYGWADQDTGDPEYFGLNVWQTDPPFEPD